MDLWSQRYAETCHVVFYVSQSDNIQVSLTTPTFTITSSNMENSIKHCLNQFHKLKDLLHQSSIPNTQSLRACNQDLVASINTELSFRHHTILARYKKQRPTLSNLPVKATKAFPTIIKLKARPKEIFGRNIAKTKIDSRLLRTTFPTYTRSFILTTYAKCPHRSLEWITQPFLRLAAVARSS